MSWGIREEVSVSSSVSSFSSLKRKELIRTRQITQVPAEWASFKVAHQSHQGISTTTRKLKRLEFWLCVLG